MKSVIITAALLVVSGIAWCEDRVFLKSGGMVEVRILSMTESEMRILDETPETPGAGPVQGAISSQEVAYIEFHLSENERRVFENLQTAPLSVLEELWGIRFHQLALPRSPIGAYGLELARRWSASDDPVDHQRALNRLEVLMTRAWDEQIRSEAQAERIRVLLRIGEHQTAEHEASQWLAQTENPVLLLEAKWMAAQVDFDALRALEQEHPRWEQDEDVKPERMRLYRGLLESFLEPSLEHPRVRVAAHRGLISAAELAEFDGDEELADSFRRDAALWYPEQHLQPLSPP